MILLSHPTANQNSRHAALAFARAGMLAEFWTCLAWDDSSRLHRALPAKLRRELSRRSFASEIRPFLRTQPLREIGRLTASHLGLASLTRPEQGPFSTDAVYRSLDSRVAHRLAELGPKIIAAYAYEDGALNVFETASRMGIAKIYDHPVIHWREVRRLQQEEKELHPEWACTLRGLRDGDEKLRRKDAEIALADAIVVASSFSKASLGSAPGIDGKRIEVIPYGCSLPGSSREEPRGPRGKLRVLFVGGLTQAKGLGYLLDAVAPLAKAVDLTLVGRRIDAAMPRPEALEKWSWHPSLPHAEVLAQMAGHDVLVLPSLHEGFGLVILEAISRGLPVIATSHTGASDVITDGVEGFVVPIRSSEAIAEKLELLASDRDRLGAMGAAALKKAGELSWRTYESRLAAAVASVSAEAPSRPTCDATQ